MPRKANRFIKPPHQETEYTPEQILELEKCSKDPIYFIEKYIKIVHPTKGAVNFNLYPYQKRLIEAYNIHKDNIVLAARQVGKCCFENSLISIINTSKISLIKRIILWLLDRRIYNELYKKRLSRS